MNAYTAKGQARIRQRDVSTILRTHWFMAAASLAALERQRSGQVDAEVDWLLKQHGIQAESVAALVSVLRQTIGAALIRAGERLAGAPRRGISLATAPVARVVGIADR